ncbi:endogenous retrovirus group K member 5 Gag polyprotein-like isoform X1 [Leptotrombidium deliense]|uniref:Endogenous retrovirus group K member 5 Gag polyprotein-like isoform X1 n=1 Tax=Leptotrombidium deliense TaxID=299467 RepID=A0A443QA24_9ACAR|nr:endogenous retrovirus group K member 5 Gag polyprotein-like isoform X1 [Leptotrombidium deliense]
MGSELSKNQMTKVIKDLLKANGTGVKENTARAYVQTLQRVSPWFLEEGLLNIPQWEQHKEDLMRWAQTHEEPLPRGTFPMWQLIRDCLLSSDTKVKGSLQIGEQALEEITERESQKDDQTERGI